MEDEYIEQTTRTPVDETYRKDVHDTERHQVELTSLPCSPIDSHSERPETKTPKEREDEVRECDQASAQISFAVSTTKDSFLITSASVTGFPSAWEAKPHCGEMQILCDIRACQYTTIEFEAKTEKEDALVECLLL